MSKVDIRKSRQSGNSVVINLTGFAEPGEFFKVESKGYKITLTRLDMKEVKE